MRILKVIHGYPPTYNAGSEVYSQSICETLAKEHQIHVFTREQNEYQLDFKTRQENRNGVPVTIINLAREKDGYEHPQVNAAFERLLLRFRADVIHIGHLNHLSLGIVKIAKAHATPILFTLHDFWLMCPRGQFLQRNFDGTHLYQICDKQENKKCAINCYKMLHTCHPKDAAIDIAYWTSWVARRMAAIHEIIPLIDLFIAPSKYLMQRFIDDFGLPATQIKYLDYGFPLHYLKAVTKMEKRPFTFAYIGTHIPAKGINLLINAFKKIKTPSRLIIWGRSLGQNTVSLQKMSLDSPNPIVFKQEYENANIVQEVFEHSDAIVVPSIWAENAPLVIHEAQACHIPVITADFGGMKEYVHHQVNGLLFEHRNANALANQLQWAVDHPAQMQSLGKHGYLYNNNGEVPKLQQHCRKLIHLYHQIILQNEAKKRTLENNY